MPRYLLKITVADVTAVNLRAQDGQVIVTGLASDPDVVTLMIQAEQQHNLGLPQLLA